MICQKRAFSVLSILFNQSKPVSALKSLNAVPAEEWRPSNKKGRQRTDNLKPTDYRKFSKKEFFMKKYNMATLQEKKQHEELAGRELRRTKLLNAREDFLYDAKVEREARAKKGKLRNGGQARIDKRDIGEKVQMGAIKKIQEGASEPNEGSPVLSRNDAIFDYVFGTHAVMAALCAGKRRIFELYTYNAQESRILRLAKEKHHLVPIEVKDKNALNQLCRNGVHNGVVLKTGKLPVPYIKALGPAENGEYEMAFEDLSDEDGAIKTVKRKVLRETDESKEELYPLMLFLDEVTDPQNMGSAIRSAFFFGVDAVIVPDHATAKLSPVAFKASAGALDLIDLYQTGTTSLKLIDTAHENGWHVISAAGRPEQVRMPKLVEKSPRFDKLFHSKYVDLPDLRNILRKSPVLLVLGSEGNGVRTHLKLRSDYLIGIPKCRTDDVLIDSLNVGVATGILLQNFIGK